MYTLEQDLISALECEKDDILSADYPEDRITEMADGYVPVYYSELAQLLAGNIGLAQPDDLGLIEGVTDVWKIIQASIYERLSAVAFEWLSQQEIDHV